MKNGKGSEQGKGQDNTVNISGYYSSKLEKAHILLEHVEECVFGDGTPIPTNIKKAYDLLMAVRENAPELFMGEKVFLWEKLGWAYYLLDDLGKADRCLRTQARFQPGCADAYINLGSFYENSELYEPAVKVYLDGLNHCPGDEFLSYNLAQLLGRIGLQDGAMEHIDAAIRSNPRRPYNYKVKGDLLKRGGLLQEAAACYEKALALFGAADDGEKREAASSLEEIRQELNITWPSHYRPGKMESLVEAEDVLFDEECYKAVNSEEEAYSYVRYYSAKAPKFRSQLIQRNWPQPHIDRLMNLLWKRVIAGCMKFGVPLTTEAKIQARKFGIHY